jgi:hypothetical protein
VWARLRSVREQTSSGGRSHPGSSGFVRRATVRSGESDSGTGALRRLLPGYGGFAPRSCGESWTLPRSGVEFQPSTDTAPTLGRWKPTWLAALRGNEGAWQDAHAHGRTMEWPEAEVWNHDFLISRVASKWSWADTAGPPPFPNPSPASPCFNIGVSWPADIEDESGGEVRHFLYFRDRPTAEDVGGRLAKKSLVGEVSKSNEDDRWLLLVTSPADRDAVVEDELVSLAEESGGQYDGSERSLRP